MCQRCRDFTEGLNAARAIAHGCMPPCAICAPKPDRLTMGVKIHPDAVSFQKTSEKDPDPRQVVDDDRVIHSLRVDNLKQENRELLRDIERRAMLHNSIEGDLKRERDEARQVATHRYHAIEKLTQERNDLAHKNSGLLSQDLERRQQIDQMHQEHRDLMDAYKALMESQRHLIRSLE